MARDGFEHRKVRRLVEEPEGNTHTDQSDDEVPLRAPSEPSKQKDYSDHKRNYSKYIVWPFVTLVGRIKDCAVFADRHAGTFGALATVIIAFLTFQYVRYSGRQWETARKNLEDFEDVQRARIIFKEHTGVLEPWKLNPNLTHMQFIVVIQNAGATVATDINVEKGNCGTSVNPPKGVIEFTPKPAPGQGLAPQDTKTYSFDCGATTGDLVSGKSKWFTWNYVLVSYRDIYGRTDAVADCVVFDPTGSFGELGWNPCGFTYVRKEEKR